MREPEKHPLFQLPENKDGKIWRFMDFTKFVALLDSHNLFFARADRLGDPFEGSFPLKAVEERRKRSMELSRSLGFGDEGKRMLTGFGDRLWDPEEADAYSARWRAEWTSISCWHMNDAESVAMWDLYAPSRQGVAVQTTYQKLRDALPDEVYIGMVKYISYKDDHIDTTNTFSPFLHKRASFAHERELRAIHQHTPTRKRRNVATGVDDTIAAQDVRNNEFGKNFKVDLNSVIERVYVSPTCPAWYLDLVKSVAPRYGLHRPIKQSELDAVPIF